MAVVGPALAAYSHSALMGSLNLPPGTMELSFLFNISLRGQQFVAPRRCYKPLLIDVFKVADSIVTRRRLCDAQERIDNALRYIYTVNMSVIQFEWDEKKHQLNKKKHGISFHEAQSAFADENGLLLDDPDHSVEEDRFILLGMSSNIRLLIISHCYSKEALTVRIISARKATRKEQSQYWSRF